LMSMYPVMLLSTLPLMTISKNYNKQILVLSL
jgi:hypothetical protein